MTILGFEEAYKNCYEFNVKEIQNGSIRVASPVGLVAMKIISWADSVDRAQKDAEDLNLIFSEYNEVLGNSERIYEYPKILEATNFDIVLSGIVLLGKDTADILNEDTLNTVRTIIDFEIDIKNNCRLASDMSKTNMFSENLEKKLQMLNLFRMGLYLR
jgi:predicted nucleotidyltransferase